MKASDLLRDVCETTQDHLTGKMAGTTLLALLELIQEIGEPIELDVSVMEFAKDPVRFGVAPDPRDKKNRPAGAVH